MVPAETALQHGSLLLRLHEDTPLRRGHTGFCVIPTYRASFMEFFQCFPFREYIESAGQSQTHPKYIFPKNVPSYCRGPGQPGPPAVCHGRSRGSSHPFWSHSRALHNHYYSCTSPVQRTDCRRGNACIYWECLLPRCATACRSSSSCMVLRFTDHLSTGFHWCYDH